MASVTTTVRQEELATMRRNLRTSHLSEIGTAPQPALSEAGVQTCGVLHHVVVTGAATGLVAEVGMHRARALATAVEPGAHVRSSAQQQRPPFASALVPGMGLGTVCRQRGGRQVAGLAVLTSLL